jgi:hypothetical protein
MKESAPHSWGFLFVGGWVDFGMPKLKLSFFLLIVFTLLFIFSIYSVPHNSTLFYFSGICVLGTLLMYIFSDK